MKSDRNFMQKLAKKRYLENVKSLINTKDRKTQAYITLGFTFAALSIFGLFAINPTVGTILELQRQLEDSKFLDQALEKKISNLSTLQQKYAVIQPDLGYLTAAVPPTANAPYFFAQIQALAQKYNLTLTSVGAANIPITPLGAKVISTIPFSVNLKGTYGDLISFVSEFISFDRIATITALSFSRDKKIDDTGVRILSIQAEAYYRP